MGAEKLSRMAAVTSIVSEFAIVIIALALPQPVLARSELRCVTNKVTAINAPGHNESSRVEEHLTFLIDDAEKTLVFADGRRLRVTRFDHFWISADGDDIRYEFNRSDNTMTYAGSTTEGNITTVIVGSGHCENPPTGKAQ